MFYSFLTEKFTHTSPKKSKSVLVTSLPTTIFSAAIFEFVGVYDMVWEKHPSRAEDFTPVRLKILLEIVMPTILNFKRVEDAQYVLAITSFAKPLLFGT